MANTSLLGSFGDISGSSLMFRNKIINGDMRIDQRNNGAKYTPTAVTYSTGLDMWQVYLQNPSTISLQRLALASSDAPFAVGLKNYARINREAAAGTANELMMLTHAIEGHNVADLNFGTSNARQFTVSFWARASGNYNFSFALCNVKSGATRTYTTAFNVTPAWQRYSYTFTAATNGSWNSDSNIGLHLRWVFGGVAFTSATDTWISDSNNYIISGQTQFQSLATNSYVDIAGVQLEAGASATPFEQRPIGTELSLCQRYYEVIVSPVGSIDLGIPVVYQGSTSAEMHVWFKAGKRGTVILETPGTSAVFGRIVLRDNAFNLHIRDVTAVGLSGQNPNNATIALTTGFVSGCVFNTFDQGNSSDRIIAVSSEL